ncbi:hypothetical protein HG535_0C00420 [Zygotorulaspora mrakii]|uniref:Uncharacterized protein n=1 Tax=Zygotorulaspora mrakii TaxID=42260 RepID=A0A7H9AZN7_ZYGMR|nr:uncharacterized protein HG535_0C00420 [Zygotorulaspora mrakii]QLG71693.1 hypothetical protein HG535_0C00420 [Zygotorulaspora mrakii]
MSKHKSKTKSKSRSKLTKRAQNALEIAEKEIAGYDSQNDDNMSRRPVVNLLRRVENGESGESGDDFKDEELDSDEALGSDEDYDVMSSRFSQTIRDAKKNAKGKESVSESGDEGGYTSIDEEDLIPLSEVWDMDDNASGKKDKSVDLQLANSDEEVSRDSMSSESEDEDEDEDEDEEDPFDEILKDDEDISLKTITADLQKYDARKHVKKLENYGSGKDSEYSLPSLKSKETGRKLNLADMMSVVDDKRAAANATLIKDNNEALSVPLPQRIQERHNRKAAYEISKQEVNKWKDVVIQNRRAEHLSFPINPTIEHNQASAYTKSNKGTQSELQEKVESVLKQSNLVEDQRNSEFEELATAKMSPEMLKKRTAEVRLMRELMFREERKSKRLKKIKSKAYHRIKKKELLKNKELAGVSDDDDDDYDAARAKERMTLKHKTNSRWAKDMIKNGMSNDAETREDIEEMLRQGERLKEKMLDGGPRDEEDGSISDIERSYEEEAPIATEKVGKSGIMNMEFMKKAEAREREENKKAIERLRAFENGQSEFAFSGDEASASDNTEQTVLNQGRRIFTPAASSKEAVLEQKFKKDEKAIVSGLPTESASKDTAVKGTKYQQNSRKDSIGEDVNFNPWLDASDDKNEEHVSRSSKVSIIDKDSSRMTKQANKISKISDKRNRNSKKSDSNDDDLLLDLEETNRLNLADPYGGSEDGERSFMFKQQESIAEAFAGDDVVADFEEEKRQIEIDEDDKEEDITLPGWGDWAGAGANPRKKRKFTKTVKGITKKEKRKDKKLDNVIINERVNKKNLKYQSSAVPFPYENKEQYERSLRMPLGPEWTSRASHQKLIKPRNLIKPSQIIDPLKAPFK